MISALHLVVIQLVSPRHVSMHASAAHSASAFASAMPLAHLQPHAVSPNLQFWTWQVNAALHVPAPPQIAPHAPCMRQLAYTLQTPADASAHRVMTSPC